MMRACVFAVAFAVTTAGAAFSAAPELAVSHPVVIEASAGQDAVTDRSASSFGMLSLVIYAIAGLGFAMRQGRSTS